MTDEQVAEAWTFREDMARLLLRAVELLADSHPEALRKALARAFECSAIEEAHGRLMTVLTQTQECANEQRMRLDERDKQIESNERRLDVMEARCDKAAAAFNSLARLFGQLKQSANGPMQKGGGR